MSDETYNDPKLAINRVYTRKGDRGTTRLVGGQKVAKDAPRIAAYGTVDELNAVVGGARQLILDAHPGDDAFADLAHTLLRVQHELFNLGSMMATLPEDIGERMPRVSEEDVAALEASIDQYNEGLAELRSFVLPGGSMLNVQLHLARTVCRRAERLAVGLAEHEKIDTMIVAYLNRLSDAFFVWSRWVAHQAGDDEVLWRPNLGASGGAS